MEKLRTTRILGAIGIIALILGIFLPYYKFSLWGVNHFLMGILGRQSHDGTYNRQSIIYF